MKTSKTLIAVTLAALIPVGAAMAGDQYGKDKDKMGTAGATFDKMDTNRDGRISQAEASVDTNIVFTSADANGDGYLDKDEWKKSSKGTNPGSMNRDPASPTPQSSPEATSDPTVPQASD